MIKKTLSILLALTIIVIAGCKSEDTSKNNITFGAGFNQTTYVWEDFMFPTNRTSGAK